MNAAATFLDEQLERLANSEPSPFPVISLYLNTQADQTGKTTFDAFVRKELRARAQTYTARSEERESYDKDVERIESFLQTELDPATHGLAIFACSGENLFEPVQLAAPIDSNELYVQNLPHLYTLAKLNDQYRKYAVVVADTDEAHIFVFGLRQKLNEHNIESDKMSRTHAGGWSQARYQRHVDNLRDQHVKELVAELDRIVAADNVANIFFAGDEVVLPMIRENLPKHLTEKLADTLKMDVKTPERDVMQQTLDAMRKHDEQTDEAKVTQLFDAYRSGGLGVLGVRQTLAALRNGQVDELVIGAALEQIEPDHEKAIREVLEKELGVLSEPADKEGELQIVLSNALVTRAQQTGAKVTFIENRALLENVGGVGALLRYRHAGVIQ
jgi:peptide chain release factor subunit 1